MRYCKTRYCLNVAAPGRLVCWKCHKRKWRKRHPYKAGYLIKKWNAKKKGIEFNVTFEEWCRYCDKTGYLKLKGLTAESQTIDRPDASQGYTINNMQPLSLHENVIKSNSKDERKAIKQRMFNKYKNTPKDPNVPF